MPKKTTPKKKAAPDPYAKTRAPKLLPEVAKNITQMLSRGIDLPTVLAVSGIDRATWRAWAARAQRDPASAYGAFARDVSKASALPDVQDSLRLDEAGKSDWRAAAWRKENRAYTRRASTVPIRDRLSHITALMISGEWSSPMAGKLAAEWGIGEPAVRRLSAEASRLARAQMPPREETEQKVFARIELAHALAVEARSPRDVLAAAQALSKAAGLDQPQKIAITTADGKDIAPHLHKQWDARTWDWWFKTSAAEDRVVGEAEMVAFEEELKRQDELAKAALP